MFNRRLSFISYGLGCLLAITGCSSNLPLLQKPSTDTTVQWHCAGKAAETGWLCSDSGDYPKVVKSSHETQAPEVHADSLAQENANVTAYPEATYQPSSEPLASQQLTSQPQESSNRLPASADDATAATADLPNQAKPTLSVEQQVLSAPANHFALQLIALTTAEAVANYREQLALANSLQVELVSQGRRYHVLIAGIYPSQQDAQQAARNLQSDYPEITPWIRSMASLQAAMAQAAEF